MRERTLLIDDDAFELSTLASAMRLHGINLVGEATNLTLAANLFRTLEPEVIVIDVQFNSDGGIPFAKSLRKLSPQLGIVLTTTCPDLRLLGLDEKEIPMGTQVVLKKCIGDLNVICTAIPDSVLAVQSDEKMIWMNDHSPSRENALLSDVHQLTDIQIETLRLVATGMSNAEIGRTRFVSEKSVEQIVARIAQHLGLAPSRKHNLRVLMAGAYFKWVGVSRR